QMPMPMTVLIKILGYAFREKNVSGVAAIHHSLRDVDAGAGDIGTLVYIDNAADRTTVHAHAQLQFGMLFVGPTDLERAFHRRFGSVVKHQGETIAGRDFNQ